MLGIHQFRLHPSSHRLVMLDRSTIQEFCEGGFDLLVDCVEACFIRTFHVWRTGGVGPWWSHWVRGLKGEWFWEWGFIRRWCGWTCVHGWRWWVGLHAVEPCTDRVWLLGEASVSFYEFVLIWTAWCSSTWHDGSWYRNLHCDCCMNGWKKKSREGLLCP